VAGTIPHDRDLVRAVKRQRPVVQEYPISTFTKAIERIGNRLMNIHVQPTRQTGILSFVRRLMNPRG